MPLPNAPVKIEFIVDRESLAELGKELDAGLRESAKSIAVELSNRAIEFLRKAETSVGHNYLAGQWTNTAPAVDADGTVSIDVYNAAEDQVFYLKSNAPNSKFLYPISGKRLLNILLNGAKAHPIHARLASNPLQFPGVRGERQSKFAGIAFLGGGLGAARFLNSKLPNTIVKTDVVHHPGVVPNRFLQAAQQLVEGIVESEGDQLGAAVSATVASGKIGETF